MATFAAGLRRPFARYWLSGFLADFGDGVRLAAFPLLAAQLTRSPAEITRDIEDRIRGLLPDPVPAVAEASTSTFPAITEETR